MKRGSFKGKSVTLLTDIGKKGQAPGISNDSGAKTRDRDTRVTDLDQLNEASSTWRLIGLIGERRPRGYFLYDYPL